MSLPVALGVVIVAGMAVTSVQRHGLGRPDGVESSFVEREAPAAHPLGATPRLDTATSGAATGGAAGELLVSRSWTNVRSRRSVKGELTAVLMPGDTVLADSLGRDWYRVSLEGEVMGYAHRSTLTR